MSDNDTIHAIISEWNGEGTRDIMRRKIVEYVATVRKEAREAAFKEVVKIAKRFDYGEADKCQRCKIASEITSAIEAAASSATPAESEQPNNQKG